MLRLSGHTDEVHSVDLRGGLLVSGAADTTVAETTYISNATIVPIMRLQSVYNYLHSICVSSIAMLLIIPPLTRFDCGMLPLGFVLQNWKDTKER